MAKITYVKIEGEQYEQLQGLKKAGLPEWKAVCKVLNIPEDTNFCTMSAGTPSKPEDGLFVKFF